MVISEVRKKKCVENAGELMFVRSQGVRGFYLGYIEKKQLVIDLSLLLLVGRSRWWQLKYVWNFYPENWGR